MNYILALSFISYLSLIEAVTIYTVAPYGSTDNADFYCSQNQDCEMTIQKAICAIKQLPLVPRNYTGKVLTTICGHKHAYPDGFDEFKPTSNKNLGGIVRLLRGIFWINYYSENYT